MPARHIRTLQALERRKDLPLPVCTARTSQPVEIHTTEFENARARRREPQATVPTMIFVNGEDGGGEMAVDRPVREGWPARRRLETQGAGGGDVVRLRRHGAGSALVMCQLEPSLADKG